VPTIPLYGHHSLRSRLAASVAAGTLPASLLLHGSRGVGKQRLALWLAQLMLCGGEGARPCDACQHCRYARDLAHPDLRWFFPRERAKDADATADDVLADYAEAAAERAAESGLYAEPSGADGLYVATVRALVRHAASTPALARRTVIVVGDAERMAMVEDNAVAANAFLKLLEEPPPHVTLVLTSSEPGALLPTIRSRLVAVRVPPVAPDALGEFLADPAVRARLDAERELPADEESRRRIARGAPGALLGAGERESARRAALRLLEAATARQDAERVRAALQQGPARARGAFAATLDALTELLHERVRTAAVRGDARAAAGAARAVPRVERAKALAGGNVNPQLVTAELLRGLADELA
jgi:DNA polymerase-3 subunit delta'